jgi:hypothetical protein
MKKLLKVFLKIFLVLISLAVVLFMVFSVYIKINGADEAPPDDSDLIPVITSVPREENAYYDLVAASEKLYWPEEQSDKINKMAEGNEWDDAFVKELIEKNKESQELFEKALLLSKFQDPKMAKIEDLNFSTEITRISGIRKVAKVNSIGAVLLLKDEKFTEALNKALINFKTGQIFEDSSNSSPIINYLIGIGLKKGATLTFDYVLQNSDFNEMDHGASNQLIYSLEEYKNNKDGLKNSLKANYVMVMNEKDGIDAQIRNGKTPGGEDYRSSIYLMTKSSFYYKPNQTRRLFIELYRNHYLPNVDKYCSNLSEPPKLLNEKKLTWGLFLTENAIGKIIRDIDAVSLSSMFSRRCEEEKDISEIQIKLAQKAYKLENKKTAADINDLVPTYLPEVPIDPFSGEKMNLGE